MTATSRFTVFLDRDGVLNKDPRWVVLSPKKIEPLPGAGAALARLNRDDVQIAVCTNQPFLSTGLLTRRRLKRIHERLMAQLGPGCRVDRWEAAAAPARMGHRRRKPKPGMLEDAARYFAARGSPVDKTRAVMVGDRVTDLGAAVAFGIPGILLTTGTDEAALREEAKEKGWEPVAVVADLAGAVKWILERAS